jgi:putative addiction module component (TIGR02574 family)
MSRVPPEIFELPIAERIELAQELWESVLDHPEALPLTEAQKAELERRWQALEADPDAGQSWESLKKSLLNE